jgi:nucleoside 2-deoxyribosyltransferase
MKLFCSYAFTGEDLDAITERMRLVVVTLSAEGHDVYCNRFDAAIGRLQAQDDIKGIFQEAFKRLEQSEGLVAIIASPNRSIGQIMEIGIAMSQKKPVYLFEHGSAEGSSYLPRLADKYFKWQTEQDLQASLQKLKSDLI